MNLVELRRLVKHLELIEDAAYELQQTNITAQYRVHVPKMHQYLEDLLLDKLLDHRLYIKDILTTKGFTDEES